MDNAWIIAFYKETDPVKRLELLKANTGDGESEKDKYRKQLWIARYGKRTPVKDEFMRCLMEMKYLAEGTTVDLGGKRRKQGAKIAATLGMSEEGVTKKIAQQISMIAFRAPHLLHMEKEFALLQEAALEAFRQVYPNREHFLKK